MQILNALLPYLVLLGTPAASGWLASKLLDYLRARFPVGSSAPAAVITALHAPRLARFSAYFLSAVVALIAQSLLAAFTSAEPLAAIDAIAAAGLAGFFAQVRHGMQLPATPPQVEKPVEVDEPPGSAAVDLFDLLSEEVLPMHVRMGVATLATDELGASFVANGDAIKWRNGRGFVMFKPPNAQRNLLQELVLSPALRLIPIGYTPAPAGVTYYKDGGCSMCFDDRGELLVLNTCSADPNTGAAARPVLWRTGIVVGPITAAGTSDTLVRTVLKNVRTALGAIP